MFKKSKTYSLALTDTNILTYIKNQYPEAQDIRIVKKGSLPLLAFLQKDYGGDDNDCTITSISTVLYYIVNYKYKMTRSFNDIYEIVRKYANKYFYKPESGLNPLFNKKIFTAAAREIGLVDVDTKCGYLKNVGYTYDQITDMLKKGMPLTLSIHKDGRNYYKNHTVSVIGYANAVADDNNLHFLIAYDNWTKAKSYIDYDKLSLISCINYVPVA